LFSFCRGKRIVWFNQPVTESDVANPVRALTIVSRGKLRTHFSRDAHRPAGLRVYRAPQSPSGRQELAITFAPDLSESFKREPGGFADPCAKHDLVTERGGRFVIDFVSQDDPANRLLSVAACDCSPVRDRNILDPVQVHSVVHVILLVDIAG
jgi:hypothetical protein